MSLQPDQTKAFTARALVEQIAYKHGHLGEEVLSQMAPEVRRQVEEALLNKGEPAGSSVITLAKNLYNSTARFVFELLQNADDNTYHIAKSTSVDPFVSFRVYDGRIVVECNEDGFTQENLVAICAVGKSSKTGAQGYIGEKGIGFKSVFMVAWKVHIQSRDFSFTFRHKLGDSGIGMISPVWEDTAEILPHPLTRITLFLHETGSDEALARQRETTLQQFRELQATFLLFMKNLRRIEVRLFDNLEEQVSCSTFSMQHQQECRVELKQMIVQGGETQERTQYYHTTNLTASNIPRSENRQYTEAELSNETYAESNIILAFPLTHDSVPIINPQEVFAFLPVRNMGLPFLIQADFVTDASRQDIVRSSARNLSLLLAIARAFIEAVKQFCAHPTLRYQWMRYLPQVEWNSQDSFWARLPEQIRQQLKTTATLWTRSQKALRRVEDMRVIRDFMYDQHGEPLLRDLEPEQYLSSDYLSDDLNSLIPYGLCLMDNREFVERLHRDLHNATSSIMWSPNTDDDWHSRVANILLAASGPRFPQTARTIKSLDLIPLNDGRWRSGDIIRRSPIYFSHVGGYHMPTDGWFDLVDTQVERHHIRKRLFVVLGVQEASVADVRYKIIFQDERWNPSLHKSRSHLQFLYLTAHLDRNNDSPSAYRQLRLRDNMSRHESPQDKPFYFPHNGPLSCQQLLRGFHPRKPYFGAPYIKPLILHPDYMRDCPQKPETENRTWRRWLNEVFYIRDVIPLTRGEHLSEECLHVAKTCQDKFLPFLLKYWKSGGAKITGSPALTKELLNLEVLCENGRMYPLAKTYVRTAQVKYADEFLREGEFFPWLKLDPSLKVMANLPDIGVLTQALGFGHPKSDLEFYLTILRFVATANEKNKEVFDVSRIFELYAWIETRYHESVTTKLSEEMIKLAFKSQRLIYVPAHGRESACWAFPHECLWEAPTYMQSSYPLKSRYDIIGKRNYTCNLFRYTLAIGDAGVDDFLLELEWIRDEDDFDFDVIYDVYHEIYKRRPEMDEATVRKVRERFEENAFIYHESDTHTKWYKPSQCLWSTVTDIKGMAALNDVYEEVSDFFIELLVVRNLTLQMVHDKLVNQGREQASTEEVKQTIWLLNSYMQNESNIPDPRQVVKAKVFPVQYPTGSVKLCSCAEDFAIADRKQLSDWFSGKAKFLDFNVNEITRLERFLQWVGLDRRYLSSSVKEISALRGDSYKTLTLPDRNIVRKAHGLLRISVHFRSPRTKNGEQQFYEVLKKIDVRETDGITSELHLNQDGKDLKVEVSHSELHFQESELGLTIYVPRDEQAQYLCFLDRIPRALMEWIMTEPSTGICESINEKALNVVSKVLQAEAKYIALTLDRAGIISVETPDDSAANEVGIATHKRVTEEHNMAPVSIGDTSASPGRIRSIDYESSVTLGDDEFMTTTYEPSIDLAYGNILRSVVNVARATAFPSRGSFNMAALSHSLDTDNESLQLRGLEKSYRDKLIGAAGELFVFEILSHLNPPLPHFCRNNWQSTIRTYVNLHEDYTDLDPWSGRETADITYADSEGVLTSLLIDKGYLDDTWMGTQPQYYLEVKSMTSSWEMPFYMSKYQYERMQNMSHVNPNPGGQASVYVIFRVYNLGRDSTAMKVYVNPGLMEEKGELVFTTDKWSVVPGSQMGVLN
ncbi:hypothetical protein BDW59DRAFT_178954 [Aspergillus cavernicola]|uniref:Protein NO VEIN C-terminal domain-containing protein n=1 Tax=Aspergillus cavernicola TaxID=176166 RepID=A0ABR4IJR4_9EURO